MKRLAVRPAVVVFLTAAIAAGAFAADPAGKPAPKPGTAKLLAKAIDLVGPAKDVPAKPILKAGDSIVCIGDSITAGGGYLRQMDACLAQQYGDLKVHKVINAGISGQKAEDFIRRFKKDVLDRKPAVVTINVGINDVWHRLGAPHDTKVLETYEQNVAKMVDQAQAAGIKVILLAPTVIQEDANAKGQKRLALYVTAMKWVAARKSCGFVDLYAMFLAALKHKPPKMKGNWLTADGVHMKPLGDAIMAAGALRAMGLDEKKIAATDIPVRRRK